MKITEFLQDPTARRRVEQRRQLKRVKRNLSDIVLDFCRLHEGESFSMGTLEEYVSRYMVFAPGSPGRILRYLRRHGKVDYEVVNRRRSYYYLYGVNE